jgi:hypothetical protein
MFREELPYMTLRIALLTGAIGSVFIFQACRQTTSPAAANSPSPTPARSKTPGPLPDNGFKAEVALSDEAPKLRTGQKETIAIRVKNTSDVIWWLRGAEINTRPDNQFYIAAGSKWRDKDGKPTDEPEGHNGIPKDLRPGEETNMTLEITAPKTPGEWILELDMVQEGVSWFGDKGSPTQKIKVTVVK